MTTKKRQSNYSAEHAIVDISDNVILYCEQKLSKRDLLILAIHKNIDLTGADLSDGDYSKLNLENIDFSFAVFDRSNMEQTKIKNANFMYASLDSVNLRNAEVDMTTNFDFANLAGADLSGLDLRGVDFRGANLIGVNFNNCNLKGVNFYGAIMDETTTVEDAVVGIDENTGRMTNIGGTNVRDGLKYANSNVDRPVSTPPSSLLKKMYKVLELESKLVKSKFIKDEKKEIENFLEKTSLDSIINKNQKPTKEEIKTFARFVTSEQEKKETQKYSPRVIKSKEESLSQTVAKNMENNSNRKVKSKDNDYER